uniref:Uncharacterized protein n=2 Tax=Trichobilharzia regenti TaxID=157069 RepID=A0AA85IQG3_TRIRE|nr:unnamed protein product [Trichobilharzia regenti]
MDQVKQGQDLLHAESDYVRQVVGEPLHHGLCSLLLYQPLDPIDFLANYLRYWVKHVRDYRRRKIAEMQVECLLQVQLPWNVGVIAEQAKRLEQDALDTARRIAAEEARRAALERARIKSATDTATRKSTDRIRNEETELIIGNAISIMENTAFKKYEQAEKARKRAEEKARRRALEEDEEGESQSGREEEEDEEDDDEDD